jgi:chaperonin GroEL
MTARSALIVANDKYDDPKLQRLRAPTHDAAELGRVLGDPTIGAYDVEVSLNQPEYLVRRKLGTFFKNVDRDDVLLLHFSCHGLKDEDGRLYFATPDTELDQLDATAVSAAWVNGLIDRSPSRRVILLLDCCYSGAFGKGSRSRAGDGVELNERFTGRGLVVLTASNSMEYAFEGEELTGHGEPSVFTTAVVQALESGQADHDGDGKISVDELYDFVFDRVKDSTSSQTPSKWMYDVQGDLVVAQSPRGAILRPAELPARVRKALASQQRMTRVGAIDELATMLEEKDRAMAEAARIKLLELVDDDSRRVAAAAEEALRRIGEIPASAIPADVGRQPTPAAQEAGGVDSEPSARHRVEAGIRQVASAIEATLGPEGREVVLVGDDGSKTVTKDALAVALRVELAPNRYERFGGQLTIEVAKRTVAETGDGGSTAVSLMRAIVEAGLRRLENGIHPVRLKRGIEAAVNAVVDDLRKQSVEIYSKQDIARAATMSSRKSEIGDVIADALEKVGKDGVVAVEEGQTFGLELELTEGMRFDSGYLSPYMVTDAEREEAVLDDAYVLVAHQKIGPVKDLLPVLEQVIQAGRPLLIVAEDVEGESLATVIVNKLRATFVAIAVKAPGFGDRRKRVLEDIAILTGGEVITEEMGLKLENTKLSQLGRVRRVVVDRDSTVLIDGAGDWEAIKARIKQLKNEIEDTDSDFDRENLQEQLAKLSGGVAVIKVGAATETEMKRTKDRVERALDVTYALLEEGFVAGGGVALIQCEEAVRALDAPEASAPGVESVVEALSHPFTCIVSNAGLDAAELLRRVRDGEAAWGIDAATGEYVDLVARGIVDPTKVVRLALQNASSCALSALTSELLDETSKPVAAPVESTPQGDAELTETDFASEPVASEPAGSND